MRIIGLSEAVAAILVFFSMVKINAQGGSLILQESFEGTQFPPTGWDTTKYSGNYWQRTTAHSSDGIASARYPYHTTQSANSFLFSPGISLNAGDSIYVVFDQKVADSDYPENLRVIVATSTNDTTQIKDTLWEGIALINETWQTRMTNKFIAPANGTYYIGFHCFSNADMWNLYIDKVGIYKFLPYDAAVTNALLPPSCNPSDSIKATVSNVGQNALSNIYVYYTVNGGNPYDTFVINNLQAGQSVTVKFSKTYPFSYGNVYNIAIFLSHPMNASYLNDTIYTVFDLKNVSFGLTGSWSGQVDIPDGNSKGVLLKQTFCQLPVPLDSCALFLKEVIIDSILHTYAADLDIYLISPANDTIELSTDNGSSNDHYINVHLTDTASTLIEGYTGNLGTPNHKYFKPEQPLSLLYGSNKNPNGDWFLWVIDDVGLDIGQVLKWTLVFDTVPQCVITSAKYFSNEGANEAVRIYVNANEVLFTAISNIKEIEIIGLKGEILYSRKNINENAIKLSLPEVPGIYIGIITLADGEKRYFKIPIVN